MTGVRTGDRGSLSMLLIPRSDAVETKPIKTSYSSSAGTAYVTFNVRSHLLYAPSFALTHVRPVQEAKVPARYLLGEEGKGTQVILSNFNVRQLADASATRR